MANPVREYPYYLLDVFTDTRLQGNPLAVFPEAENLSATRMQKIAGELNLSETVFLLKHENAAARARIFTPRRELDFAGHPTIGSAALLAELRGYTEAFGIVENVGLIPIHVRTDKNGGRTFWLTTPEITFYETLAPAFCAQLLGLSDSDIAAAPPQFVSAGSPVLIISLRTVEAVDRAILDQTHLEKALGSVNSVGTFFFARKYEGANEPSDVYSRMFAPQSGIAEDPATGGATGPLAAYMLKYGMLEGGDGVLSFSSEQGTKMGRRSLLYVEVQTAADSPVIKVGGNAVITAKGLFMVD